MSRAMIRAFILSLAQLGDRAILKVFVKSMALTFAIFAALGLMSWWGTAAALGAWVGPEVGPEIGQGVWQGAGALATAFALFVTLLALWLLFRAVAILVVGVFADDVVAAVERRHYPAAIAGARTVSLRRGLAMGVRSALRFVGVNLLLAPLYIVLLATGIGTPALFFAVNAWLLGRDLGDMVAARHLGDTDMAAWRRATIARRFLLGLGGTALFVVPFVNILAPILGAAMATHLFHESRI